MSMCYDKLANVFDERYQRQSFPGIQNWVRRLAISGETRKVLEVGCGTGHWLNILNLLQVELFGLDPSCDAGESAVGHEPSHAHLCGR